MGFTGLDFKLTDRVPEGAPRAALGLGNLEAVGGRGRFRFIGLLLKIRGGTASPIRAVALFE